VVAGDELVVLTMCDLNPECVATHYSASAVVHLVHGDVYHDDAGRLPRFM
jgi:hypothetical protein